MLECDKDGLLRPLHPQSSGPENPRQLLSGVIEMKMNAREQEQYRQFRQEHRQHGVRVERIQTGIGVKVVVRCRKCDKEKDITDYASW